MIFLLALAVWAVMVVTALLLLRTVEALIPQGTDREYPFVRSVRVALMGFMALVFFVIATALAFDVLMTEEHGYLMMNVVSYFCVLFVSIFSYAVYRYIEFK